MVDMIEQTHGAGLSGIAGATGKGAKNSLNAKNSLFGKLLVMLEQHGKLAGKGHALLLGKDGKLATLSNKGDPLIASKSKHLLALAAKGKHHVKSQADDQATPLLAAHAFIDAAILSKKSVQSGKAIVALQTISGKHEQSAMAGKAVLQTSAFETAGTKGNHGIETGKTDKIGQAQLAEAKLSGAESNAGLFTSEKSTSDKSATGVEQTKSAVQKIAQGLAHQTQNSAPVAGANLQASEQTQVMAGKESVSISRQPAAVESRQSGQKLAAFESGQVGQTEQKLAAFEPGQSRQKMAATQWIDERIASATGQNSQVAAEKTAMRTNAESANALAGAHFQQNKAVQLQQAQSVTTNSAAATAGIAISGDPDASLADTGSQASDKGNQDGRLTAALSGDAKAANASAASSTSFHQYLSGKTMPSMTLFDTMNHIAQSASKGKTRLEIQLEPANLGKIQISLQSDAAKQLQVHIIVDQGTTRAALEQQLPQLRSALAQQGFDLSGFSMGSQNQQNSTGNTHQGRQGDQAHQFAIPSEDIIQPSTANVRRAAGDAGLSIRI